QVVQSTTTVNRTAPVTALRAMPGAQRKSPSIWTGGRQQHRLTQAPLKTLRKTKGLVANFGNIV
ncbi:hypothetical protein, partial [Ectopseudomonas oleovorans]|uniref:hypothetical protein n=1 Tax=Ectopseudomonas oleovorans TaxID=301 RepID=UPI0024485390